MTDGGSATTNDNITGGAGNDVFSTTSGYLDAGHVIDGGDGTDSFSLTNITAVADSALENKTSIEKMTSAATGLAVTLDKNAQAMGITTVTFAGTAAGGILDTVTIQDDVTNAITVNLDDLNTAGNDDDHNTVDASTYTGVLTINTNSASSINGAAATEAAFTGGTGTSDTLNFHGATLDGTELGNISAIENWVVKDDTATDLTTVDANVADGKSLSIDARAIVSSNKALTCLLYTSPSPRD